MGTRNLTIVKNESETRVAQYGQWDGYLTGQGETISEFLRKVDLDKFKEQIKSLNVYTQEEIKKAWKDAGAGDSAFVSSEIADLVKKNHPALNRDEGANILNLIYDGIVTKVHLDEGFREDRLFCEYCYEIDLDDETVSVNRGKKYTFKQWAKEGLMKKLEDKENEQKKLQ